ncbi:MAG: ABC transporter ATP-binding protein, partial [Erysipelotrichaceae bacterium]|nr:ABC transporter ATP-binding protein [Erysipelotrichaceae bacterium]
MLVLQNISKTYQTGELVQKALDKVSLALRDNEFVAVLGPSGSGKTTLLNIIGGLDRYDEGDLLINGVSTKDYKDRDWDSYRNHAVGFVFQSYNLIPHQTILSNVELALTIGGVSAKERRKRALKALDEVGLKEQAHKKPNQMSGGQMQRVAIARALVNDPEILLADEPTGALDSKTSFQVMELLKEVARDRLVVMVTHNPELADAYATRIVKLRDGQIIADSDPCHRTDSQTRSYSKRKAHMSFLTALSLSFHNLLTKKSRTILTSFAGSIGIIGIALILSLSTGFQNYIDKIQEDTLSSYPLTITSETADAASAILSMVSDQESVSKQDGQVKEKRYLTSMFSAIGSNDLRSFKKYLETHENEYRDDVSQIRYSYGISPLIYTIDAADNLAKLNPSNLLSSMYSSSATSMLSSFSAASGNSIFSEMNDDDSYRDQYKVLAGRWPEHYDELLIVLSEEDAISDLLVYSLGLRDTNELKTIINDVMSGIEYDSKDEPKSFSYEDLLNIELKLLKATDIYRYNSQYDIYEDMSGDEEYMRSLYERSLTLKITGIVCAEDRNASMALSTGVAYTKDLTRYIIEEAMNTAIVQKQLRNKEVDVFSHNRFDEENKKDENIDLKDMITIDEKMLEKAFKVNVDTDALDFEEIDENEMQKIVMKSAQDAADMIAELPDATAVTGVLTTLNMSMLQEEIDRYEKMDDVVSEGFLYLDEEKLEMVRKEINAGSYKNYAKTLVSNIAELSEYEALTDVLPQENYEELAKAVALMF